MNNNEIYELFRQFDCSWKVYYSPAKNVVLWKDWNGVYHTGYCLEELRHQLSKAPLRQQAYFHAEV